MRRSGQFQPVHAGRLLRRPAGVGVGGAAATIFFAYVGFDAVSTAAEETKNPQRNVPIGLIGSLGICTIFYILVAAGAIGTIGGQPIMGAERHPADRRLARARRASARCRRMPKLLVCSNEALAHVLRKIGYGQIGNCDRLCRLPGAAVGHPDPAVRPDPHLLRDVARRPAARTASPRSTRSGRRLMSSPPSPASASPSRRPCCRSASSPTSPMPARSTPSSWWRWR